MVKAESNPDQARKVFAILFRVYGLCLLAAAIATAVCLFSVNDLIANSTRVDGQVVDLERTAKGGIAPVVRFTTRKGEVIQLRSGLATSPAPKLGDSVKVLYRTSNPQDWRIDDLIHLYFWTFMGLFFMFAWALALAIVKLLHDRQNRVPERM